MSSLRERMVRAASLDAELYEEVEADESALGQAMAVVVLAALAAGIGRIGVLGLGGLITTTLTALLAWYVWAYAIYLIGTRILPEPQTRADHGELLRTLGFAAAPGLIQVLGVIPALGPIALLVGNAWMLVATVVAVRQALDYDSTLRAIGVCAIGWLAFVVIQTLVYLIV